MNDETEPERSFVPDDEQVVRLLSRCDGYAWQSDIAAELSWLPARASRTLTFMEKDGRVARYQFGRRKVVCLPHREPAQLRDRRARSDYTVGIGNADSLLFNAESGGPLEYLFGPWQQYAWDVFR